MNEFARSSGSICSATHIRLVQKPLANSRRSVFSLVTVAAPPAPEKRCLSLLRADRHQTHRTKNHCS